MTKMIKMQNSGVTKFVPEKEVDRHLRAGYVILRKVETEAEAEVEVEAEDKKAPRKSKRSAAKAGE